MLSLSVHKICIFLCVSFLYFFLWYKEHYTELSKILWNELAVILYALYTRHIAMQTFLRYMSGIKGDLEKLYRCSHTEDALIAIWLFWHREEFWIDPKKSTLWKQSRLYSELKYRTWSFVESRTLHQFKFWLSIKTRDRCAFGWSPRPGFSKARVSLPTCCRKPCLKDPWFRHGLRQRVERGTLTLERPFDTLAD